MFIATRTYVSTYHVPCKGLDVTFKNLENIWAPES